MTLVPRRIRMPRVSKQAAIGSVMSRRGYRSQRGGKPHVTPKPKVGAIRRWSTNRERTGDAGVSSLTLMVMSLGMASAAFVACAIWDEHEEKKRKRTSVLGLNNIFRNFSLRGNGSNATSITIYREEQDLMPQIKERMASLNDGQRLIYSIMAINGLVFMAWKIPRLYPFMTRYFLNSPAHHPMTLFTSTYSHHNGFHLLFNMFAINSFGISVVNNILGAPQFLFLYTSAGVMASLGSCLWKKHVAGRLVSLLPWYRAPLSGSSLGASGSLYGLLGIVAHFPQWKIGLVFLPGVMFGMYARIQ